MNDSESETAAVPLGVKQAESGPAQWAWVDRGVWTDRMLAALGNGVKGHVSFAELGLFTKCRPSCKRANPDEETTDWRAVCGKTARTVRREGRPRPSLPLSNTWTVRMFQPHRAGSIGRGAWGIRSSINEYPNN
jgi:hypothetical protein